MRWINRPHSPPKKLDRRCAPKPADPRAESFPPVCILEFDGDITDWLVRDGIAKPFGPLGVFFTPRCSRCILKVLPAESSRETIGGPYAVLIAEQLQAAGGQTHHRADLRRPACLPIYRSRVSWWQPARFVTKETSYHYLPPDSEVACKSQVVPASRAGVDRHRMGRPLG